MILFGRLNPKRTVITFMLILAFFLNCFLFFEFRNRSFDSNEKKEVLKFRHYGKKFCVLYNFWNASEEYFSGNHITLVLHSTVDYLSYLEEQSETWDGGISFALYIPIYNDSFIADAISETIFKLKPLRKKLKYSEKIGLHLFFQTSKPSNCAKNYLPNNEKLKYELPESRFTYPINVARNIGRKGSGTELFISGDIEQIYVKNFEPKMLKLANRVLLNNNKTKTVLVHRRFELAPNTLMPTSKAELRKLYYNGLAVSFHERLYPSGHYIPRLHQWMKSRPNSHEISITQTLKYGNIQWEPQFVGNSQTPFHDERFPYRFRSNAHLSNLLCMHNFSFSIVSEVFSIHRGIIEKLAPTKKGVYDRLKKLGVDRVNEKFFRELKKLSPKRYRFCFERSFSKLFKQTK